MAADERPNKQLIQIQFNRTSNMKNFLLGIFKLVWKLAAVPELVPEVCKTLIVRTLN